MAIDGRIDSNGEDVLVILRKHTWVHNIAVVTRLARIDVDTADDASRSSLDVDASALVEFVREDVSMIRSLAEVRST